MFVRELELHVLERSEWMAPFFEGLDSSFDVVTVEQSLIDIVKD